jgi:hypothetical protein
VFWQLRGEKRLRDNKTITGCQRHQMGLEERLQSGDGLCMSFGSPQPNVHHPDCNQF